MSNSSELFVVSSESDQLKLIYDFRVPVCDVHIAHFFRPLDDRGNGVVTLEDIGKVGQALAKGILEIPGVTEVYFQVYRITIIKASLFSWTDIREAATKLITSVLEQKDAAEAPAKAEEFFGALPAE